MNEAKRYKKNDREPPLIKRKKINELINKIYTKDIPPYPAAKMVKLNELTLILNSSRYVFRKRVVSPGKARGEGGWGRERDREQKAAQLVGSPTCSRRDAPVPAEPAAAAGGKAG